MTQQPSILVVDDEMGILDVLRILLKGEGFDVVTAQGGKAGLEALKASAPDIVLTDIKMPGVSGTEILAAVREQDPETPVILMTAQASLQSAIQAVNQGAFYYIQKPFSNDDLVAICRRAGEQRLLKAENKQLKQEIRRRERSGLVKPLGKSRAFQDVLRLAEGGQKFDLLLLGAATAELVDLAQIEMLHQALPNGVQLGPWSRPTGA